MKTLIIVSSTYLGNTMKVAKAMAEELKALIGEKEGVLSLTNLSATD